MNSYSEAMTIYGNMFFEHLDKYTMEELINKIEYNIETVSYSLDSIYGTELQENNGNLTGLGTIPTQGIELKELELALSYNHFLRYITIIYLKQSGCIIQARMTLLCYIRGFLQKSSGMIYPIKISSFTHW